MGKKEKYVKRERAHKKERAVKKEKAMKRERAAKKEKYVKRERAAKHERRVKHERHLKHERRAKHERRIKLQLRRALDVGRTVALKGGRGKRFCADEANRVICNRPWIRGWEKFLVAAGGPGRVALQGGHRKNTVLMKATESSATDPGSEA